MAERFEGRNEPLKATPVKPGIEKPERVPPLPPKKEPSKRKVSRRRRWIAAGVTTAVLGGGLGYELSRSPDTTPIKPPSSPTVPVSPSVHPTSHPTQEPNGHEKQYVKERAEVQKNIDSFFKLSRSEFLAWAQENKFEFVPGVPWSFPWPDGSSYNDSLDSIKWPSGKSVKPEPNLSVTEFNNKSHAVSYLGINLGINTVPLKNGDEATILWVGSIFPSYLSTSQHDRIVYPIVVNLNTKNPLFKESISTTIYTTTPFYFETPGSDHYEVGPSTRGVSIKSTRDKYLRFLEKNIGQPFRIGVGNRDFYKQIGFHNAASFDVYESLGSLFENDSSAVSRFWEKMERYEGSGKITLSDKKLFPRWTKGASNFQEVYNHAIDGVDAILSFKNIRPIFK